MDKKEKIVLIRNILNNANNMNIKTETILKISRKIDEYIIEYYREKEKTGGWERWKRLYVTIFL